MTTKFPNDSGALRIKPVKKHVAPGYPSYATAGANPALLEKLPSRWQENAKVLACVGMVGTFVVANAQTNNLTNVSSSVTTNAPTNVTANVSTNTIINIPVGIMTNAVTKITSDNAKVKQHFHHGGTGFTSSFYVVYLTEQEALSIIQTEAKEAGIALSTTPFMEYHDFGFGRRELIKRHDNAFQINGVKQESTGRGRGNIKIDNAFILHNREMNRQNKKDDGISWGEFIKLLKQPVETKQTPTP